MNNSHESQERVVTEMLNKVVDRDVAKDYLVPVLAGLATKDIEPEELIGCLVKEVSDFADQHTMGLRVIELKRIPLYIDVIVPDDKENKVAQEIWKVYSREYQHPENGKIPRKMKKALPKSQSQRGSRERELAEKFYKRQKKV